MDFMYFFISLVLKLNHKNTIFYHVHCSRRLLIHLAISLWILDVKHIPGVEWKSRWTLGYFDMIEVLTHNDWRKIMFTAAELHQHSNIHKRHDDVHVLNGTVYLNRAFYLHFNVLDVTHRFYCCTESLDVLLSYIWWQIKKKKSKVVYEIREKKSTELLPLIFITPSVSLWAWAAAWWLIQQRGTNQFHCHHVWLWVCVRVCGCVCQGFVFYLTADLSAFISWGKYSFLFFLLFYHNPYLILVILLTLRLSAPLSFISNIMVHIKTHLCVFVVHVVGTLP